MMHGLAISLLDERSRFARPAVGWKEISMSACVLSEEIVIFDDNCADGEALAAVLASEGFRVTVFRDRRLFVDVASRTTAACLILEINMPDCAGLEILNDIDAANYDAPVVILSGTVTVPIAVEAIKRGAFDVLEKPFDPQTIAEHVRSLIITWKLRRDTYRPHSMSFPGIERLSGREREVLAEIAAAASNKEVGRSLGLSPRTIEAHRAHIMLKLGAKNTAHLMRLVLSKRSN